MLKSAVDRSEEILSTPPSRTEESVKEFISKLKIAKRDLIGEKNDPRNLMGSGSLQAQTRINAALGQVEDNILNAELALERVRNEIPQEETVETDKLGELNIQASVEKLAVASAVSTMGENRFNRLSKGLQSYTQEIEAQLDPNPMLREFPRKQFTSRLEELIAMDSQKLAAEYQKTFPTKEWIGPDPEPVGGEGELGYIPTHFEKDETTQPANEDVDSNIEDNIEKERKFRGIQKSDQAGKALEKASKTTEGGNKVTADAVNSTPGSHEPASSSDGGAQLQAKPPEPEEAFENVIEEEGNKSTGAPRGPNRRTNKDVPAYSTPKDKLTAALKLAAQYENMDAETALQIVNTVFANGESEEEAESKADENATGSGEEATEHDQVDNKDLDGLFDD
jgi:hypothetical protein